MCLTSTKYQVMSALKIEVKGSVIGLESESGQVAESVKVFSIDGTFVEDVKVADGEVSLAHLKKGGYVVSVALDGKTHVKRFFRD